MTKESSTKPLLIATASFVGGIAAGLLLSPQSGPGNRTCLFNRATELTHWLEQRRKTAAHKSGKEFHKLHQNFHRGLKRSLPDFYKATEHISLSDRDLLNE